MLLRAPAHPSKRARCPRQDNNGQDCCSCPITTGNRAVLRRERVTVAASIIITRTRSARGVGDRSRNVLDKERADGSQDIHLLAGPGFVKGILGPGEAALSSVRSARACGEGCLGRCPEDGENLIRKLGNKPSDLGQPAVDVALEAEHVGGAGSLRLASNFVCNTVGEKDLEGIVYKAFHRSLPLLRSIGLVWC